MRAWLWVAVGCSGTAVNSDPGELEQGPISVRVMLDGAPRQGGGDLVVQVQYDANGSIKADTPVATGLEFTPNGAPTLENLGSRVVVTQRYVYSGAKGNYEIVPLVVPWTGPDPTSGESTVIEAQSTSVFLDIQAEPIVAGELMDIEEPDAIWRVPWLPILAVGALFATGVGVAFWPRRREEEVAAPPIPAHVAALQAWEAVRKAASLTDEDKARELSLIFRQYAEAVFRFEASAWTTAEILAHLGGLKALAEGNIPRAKRMLRATDRIKFAEERPSHELIDELDADLRAFVDSTRPHVWREE